MPFKCNGYNLVSDVFITEADIIDRFVGNQLWLWGAATNGVLGDNTTITKSSPVQTVSTGTNWEQTSVTGGVSAAIKSDGTLWLWGWGSYGRLGNNSTINQSSPVQTVSTGNNWKQVSSGIVNVGAVKTDGTLWLWGAATCGGLGDNSTINKSSPVQTVSTGNNWKQIALAICHSAAVKTDGTLWIWGDNASGQLGDSSTIKKSSPVQTISTGNNWKQVSLGAAHSAAVKTDGTLWIWGNNVAGNLGNNSVVSLSSPAQTVLTGNNWKLVSSQVQANHTAAIKIDGTLWLWGCNANGQLGDNSTINKSIPVQTVSNATNWKMVSVGDTNSTAIETDSSLWLWGNGASGRLGNNSTISQSSPVQTVSQGTNWKQVSAGSGITAAVNHTDN